VKALSATMVSAVNLRGNVALGLGLMALLLLGRRLGRVGCVREFGSVTGWL